MNAHDIFISYSRKNLDEVKSIKKELEGIGFDCWMDLEGIESGSREFSDHLIAAIDASTAMLFFLSDDSQTSEWARKEIGYAQAEKKHVVLVRYNDDRLTKQFRFEFGRADIVDWRKLEQKGKLLRDLGIWTGKEAEIRMPKPKVPPVSFPESLACQLDQSLPWQDFRLVAGIQFLAGDGTVWMTGHAVGSPWGIFLVGFTDSSDTGSDGEKRGAIPPETSMREFAAAIAAQCGILPARVHYLFAIPAESFLPGYPDWVVASETVVLEYLKKFEKEIRVLDWANIHRGITQRLESFPMTHMGREANILKHFNAGTPEELEDGTVLLAWADNPSEALLDAAEKVCHRVQDQDTGNARLFESVKAWFRVMADRGNVVAMDHYGWFLDESKAAERVEWFRRAADFGGAHAQNSLGWCLHEGWGIERNRDEALRLFRASAAQGNRFGQASLARAYADPEFAGLPQDPAEAFRLWRLSAEQGLPEAQFSLGECYEKGLGTNPDIDAARRWYGKAACAGNEKAKSALGRLSR